ncbi:MAG: hypothetical protein ACJAYG_001924 [Oceanicoccus sp.]|jgi:hypothetical protein
MNKPTPSIGNWYRDIQQGITFEVVAVDDSSRTIETQLIDGAITEYDFENWLEMLVEEIEAPEDWRNAYELSSEDSLDPDDTIYPEDWNGPLSMIETDIVIGIPDDI